ncbi:MAG: tail fiber protein [Anaerolineae bacterium]|nr:tail fiber protein [Anaerolineae bacterium]
MAQPYVGEIRMFGGNFAPAGWAFCEGQLLPISEYETLFNLIGTTYGGDGESTFAMPDLRGRIPIHQGQGPGLSSYILAETGGVESVTLAVSQLPSHTHLYQATGSGGTLQPSPVGAAVTNDRVIMFSPGLLTPDTMPPQTVSPVGGNQPHDNMMPFLCVSFIISLFGIFPSPT